MHLYTQLLKQPKSFWVLSFGELCSSFSYYGTHTILILYCMHTFGLAQSESYLLYGAYAVLAYSLPLLGGIVADRWLGTKNTVILGSALNILGNLLLTFPQHYLFCLGLTTSLVGSGLYKSSATHLIGTLYQEGDNKKKETGFTVLYLFINIGAALSPLVYGLIIYVAGWNFCFLFSAIIISIATILFLRNAQLYLSSLELVKKSNPVFVCFGIFLLCLFLSLLFYKLIMMNVFIFLIFTGGIIYLLTAIKKYQDQDKRHLIALLWISFFSIFYFAASLQIGSTVTLFIQHHIQLGDIHTQLPASIFTSFYPLFVLLLAPFFTYTWHRLDKKGISVNAPTRLVIGMLLAVLGISAFAFASTTSFVLTGVLVGNLLLSAGELAIVPAIYTAVSNLSPVGMKNTMMGCWFLSVALGGYLSGVLAEVSYLVIQMPVFHQAAYFGQFIFIAGFTFIVAVIVAMVAPKLSKMMQTTKVVI
jgi:POT family proton-dependent oligopeptide transporter